MESLQLELKTSKEAEASLQRKLEAAEKRVVLLTWDSSKAERALQVKQQSGCNSRTQAVQLVKQELEKCKADKKSVREESEEQKACADEQSVRVDKQIKLARAAGDLHKVERLARSKLQKASSQHEKDVVAASRKHSDLQAKCDAAENQTGFVCAARRAIASCTG
eukprot:3163521-Pleurochrysis_carterae.AAC.1